MRPREAGTPGDTIPSLCCLSETSVANAPAEAEKGMAEDHGHSFKTTTGWAGEMTQHLLILQPL